MGWWGFIFPSGVFADSTIQFGEELPSLAFQVFGAIFAYAAILLWVIGPDGTAREAWTGQLFIGPCLANLQEEARVNHQENEKGEMTELKAKADEQV